MGCDLAGHSSNREVRQTLESSEGHFCADENESVTGVAVSVALFHNRAYSTIEDKQIQVKKYPVFLLTI